MSDHTTTWLPSPVDFDPELMAKRSNVIKEIVYTEASYFENLKVVKDVFIDSVFNRKSPESSVLTREEYQVVFINWRELYLNSNRLSKALVIRCDLYLKHVGFTGS